MQLLAGIAILGGCRGEQVPTEAATHLQLQAEASQSFGASVNKDLATLRQVTAPFQRFDVASDAGWSAPITACMTDPNGAGGMGFHYGNVGLIDGVARVDEPELLLYEPEQNYSARSSSRTTPFNFGDFTPGYGRKTRAACSPAGTRT